MRSILTITELLQSVLTSLGYNWPEKTTIEPPKDKKFGDLAINCALMLAKEAKKSPRDLAEEIASLLRASSQDIAQVDIAGPGFLNIWFTPEFWHRNITIVEDAGTAFGTTTVGKGKKVQVEFVSANPTGPLHIGHGRGAAVGDSMARILRFAGYEVSTEYYLNDAGNQIKTLGRSIWLRLREQAGAEVASFPEDCYQGEYIKEYAQELFTQNPQILELEEEGAVALCGAYGLEKIREGIAQDLAAFRVHHDVWFSELDLVRSGFVDTTLQTLEKQGFAEEEAGALWFRSSRLGDDKDRVLRKSDGSLTYFASDIAYHSNKYQRGFDIVIDVLGADHHGYIARMRACIEALGQKQEAFDVLLVQLVNLMRGGVPIAMSTRAGEFVTLADVVNDVGVDAARFIFLSRKSDSKLDFDLELVKQRTMENPVYYVQYAHARIMTLLNRAAEREFHIQQDIDSFTFLSDQEALDLLRLIGRFPQIVKEAAINYAPHYISYYLMDLAGALHKYYSIHQVLQGENLQAISARLRLLRAVAQVLSNGLCLLGVNAPDSM